MASYVHEYYHAKKYKLAYKGVNYPICDSSTWEKIECLPILPSHIKKQPRKRKKSREEQMSQRTRTASTRFAK